MSDYPEYGELVKAVSELEPRLGLRAGFFEQLIKEDDWSFVIKAYSLMEAAVTLLITKSLANNALDEFVYSLFLNDQRRGKIALANALHLMENESNLLFQGLSKLRNKLVHDVIQTQFNFSDYIPSLNKQELQNFCDSFGQTFDDPVVTTSGKAYPKSVYILKYPKTAVWRSCLLQLAIMSIQVETQDL